MQVAYPCLKPLNSWFSDFEETMLFVSCHLPGFVRMAQGLERATYSILVGSVINTPNFVHFPWNVAISFDVHKESRSLRKHVSVGRICVAYIVVILWPIWNSWLCIVRIIPGFYCALSGVTCQHISKLITGTHSVYGKLVEEWSSSKFLGADSWDWWWPSWWLLTTISGDGKNDVFFRAL